MIQKKGKYETIYRVVLNVPNSPLRTESYFPSMKIRIKKRGQAMKGYMRRSVLSSPPIRVWSQ